MIEGEVGDDALWEQAMDKIADYRVKYYVPFAPDSAHDWDMCGEDFITIINTLPEITQFIVAMKKITEKNVTGTISSSLVESYLEKIINKLGSDIGSLIQVFDKTDRKES